MRVSSSARQRPDGADPVPARPLRALELGTGIPFGPDDSAPSELPGGGYDHPRQALAVRLAAALTRTPCVVSFSGGRDSSAVLASAVEVARREGLPAPIPVTLRFPGVRSTEESDWQRLVVDHLGLRDWEVITLGDELDLLGETARAALRAHGVMWPPNAHLHVPIFERASGGSVLTGFDGDGLFGSWRWARLQAVVHGRMRPEPRDLARIALALAPPRLRRLRVRPPLLDVVPWLRPNAHRALSELLTREAASEPLRWDRRLTRYARGRFARLQVHSLGVLAAARRVNVCHPLHAPEFLAALAGDGGAAGYGDRTAAMEVLFGDLLPGKLTSRPTKAEFGGVFWGPSARQFAAEWRGGGINHELVDAERLREAWNAPNPLFGSATLLQAAWLAEGTST